MKFVIAYIKSMRLYYAFITGIAGWIGVSYYEFLESSIYKTIEESPSIMKKVVILILLFLSWGINQIVNDYMGLKEDRINAPNRPMVTGELNSKKAILISFILICITSTITIFYLEPLALIPLILGICLNILYEYAKGYGVYGNIVFGLMISMCTVFGFLATGPMESPYFTCSRLSVLSLVIVLNAIMTFYTYFKDYKGDKKTNKNTLVVQMGIKNAKILAITFAIVPFSLFIVLYSLKMINTTLHYEFIILGIITLFLQLWTGTLFFRNPVGKKTYYSLSVNFRACTCGQAALIALFNVNLSIMLFLISYIFIEFLFSLYSNPKS
ncbi:MAG: UbiA family prenyltransferase [Clostridiales bacterium]